MMKCHLSTVSKEREKEMMVVMKGKIYMYVVGWKNCDDMSCMWKRWYRV
jgi:hypothetical protein